ncbi:hypothetical protein [Mucilaginibacter terrae]|uniref:Uncharacterized protein n=1 Tax=Mucilaginibacter terrae TaxID=1955052 RepID=A0ABU3GUK1_9SPHI|nr:hypothetical protein [Mucilaginibacter terrae]MDT3403448.1 hypothetical protein [Mucilaginibacter terrae]
MKKAVLTLIAVGIFATSCYRSHSSITVSDGHSYLKIEYAGTVVFNDEKTRVVRISPGGYFKCTNNNDKLNIESDRDGKLHYEVNSDDWSNTLNPTGQALMKQAAKEIARQHEKRRS